MLTLLLPFAHQRLRASAAGRAMVSAMQLHTWRRKVTAAASLELRSHSKCAFEVARSQQLCACRRL